MEFEALAEKEADMAAKEGCSISALGGERDRFSLTCFSASAARVAYLATDGPDLQRRSAFAQCPSLSGHGDLA